MKKLLTFSILAVSIAVLFTSCVKRDYYNSDLERASVLDYEAGTPYSIIQYDYDGTYAVVESMDYNTDLWPLDGDRLEGVFYEGQTRRVYNLSTGDYISLYVVENVPTRSEAYDALYYYADRYAIAKGIDKSVLKSQNLRRGGLK